MFDYMTVDDFAGSQDITRNGRLIEIGAEGWEFCCLLDNENGRRRWLFKRKLEVVKTEKRGRPAGSKNKVKQ